MTLAAHARELAELEGVRALFDSLVTETIEGFHAAGIEKILATPGRAPSEVMKQTKTLEGAMKKIEHNLRSQYDEFLSEYVAARERTFSPEQIAEFVATLREQRVQHYMVSMIKFRKELLASVSGAMTSIARRAVSGPGSAPFASNRRTDG